MVEIWLPYRDTELPVMLPDPIDLKIAPKTVLPEAREYEVLNRLYKLLRDYEDVKIAYNPLLTEAERSYIRSILLKAEIKFEDSTYDEANICIDILRYDPILKFRTSLWIGYLYKDTLKKLSSLLTKKEIDPLRYFHPPTDKLHIDLIIDGGPRLVNIFSSTDGSHYQRAISFYKDRWCLKTVSSNLLIASVGGSPWDLSFYLVVNALIKLTMIIEEGGIGILVGDGVLKDVDPTKIKEFTADKIRKAEEFYLLYYMNMMDRLKGTIVYYGSVPGTITKMLGLRKIRDIEAYIKGIPKRLQRDVLVIEDMTFVYPFQCTI